MLDVQYALENGVCAVDFGWSVLKRSIWSNLLVMLFKSFISLTEFVSTYFIIIEERVVKPIIMDLSITP